MAKTLRVIRERGKPRTLFFFRQDEVRALSALAGQPKPWRRLIHALRGALVAVRLVKGGA